MNDRKAKVRNGKENTPRLWVRSERRRRTSPSSSLKRQLNKRSMVFSELPPPLSRSWNSSPSSDSLSLSSRRSSGSPHWPKSSSCSPLQLLLLLLATELDPSSLRNPALEDPWATYQRRRAKPSIPSTTKHGAQPILDEKGSESKQRQRMEGNIKMQSLDSMKRGSRHASPTDLELGEENLQCFLGFPDHFSHDLLA